MPLITDTRKLVRPEDVKIGWVCAVQRELQAALATLDETFRLPPLPATTLEEASSYTIGRIGPHKVVIVCLTNARNRGAAAKTAIQLRKDFQSLQLGFMVGIAGGVTYWGDDIRLGDVVVSRPDNASGGVVAWDGGKFGKTNFSYRGFYAAPAERLLTLSHAIEARWRLKEEKLSEQFTATMDRINERLDPAITRPDSKSDILYWPHHQKNSFGPGTHRPKVWDAKTGKTREGVVDPRTGAIKRDGRPDLTPRIHHGIVASGGSVMGRGEMRDHHMQQIFEQLELKPLCFEMEAADLMNTFPCLIVRGISDYADEHKNDDWQGYAALSAAAYTKVLISAIEAPTVAGQSESGPLRGLEMTTDERVAFQRLFDLWDSEQAGFLSGEMARQIFPRSRLNHEDLRAIFKLTDRGGRGILSKDQFVTAMLLIFRTCKGDIDPQQNEEQALQLSRQTMEMLRHMPNRISCSSG